MTDDYASIHTIDENHSVADPAMWVVNTLQGEWDESRVLNITPLEIRTAEDMKAVQFRQATYITVYDLQRISKPVVIDYGYENEVHIVSIEARTSEGRRAILLIEEEIKRIMRRHRKDTMGNDPSLSGRWWLQYLRCRPSTRTAKGTWFVALDFEIHNVMKVIN